MINSLFAQREDIIVAQYSAYQEQLAAHHKSNPKARKCEHASLAPTAALAVLKSTATQWQGVRFVLAHGKATATRQAYIKVLFKDASELTFHMQGNRKEPYRSM